MKHTVLALTLVLAPVASAQDPGAVEARLVSASDIVVSGSPARFTLTVNVLEDTSLRVRARILTRWLQSAVQSQRAKESVVSPAKSHANLN